ncbi:MAG: hypothetical protein AAF492_10245, partial [Verrucomicrobiota bacterium]
MDHVDEAMPNTPRYTGIKVGYGLDLSGHGRSVVKAVLSGLQVRYENLAETPALVGTIESDVERGR